MTYFQAMRQSIEGRTVISNTGVKYAPDQLNVRPIGERAVMAWNIVSKPEMKGEWRIE